MVTYYSLVYYITFTVWKHEKTFGFLVVSGGNKKENLPEMKLPGLMKFTFSKKNNPILYY